MIGGKEILLWAIPELLKNHPRPTARPYWASSSAHWILIGFNEEDSTVVLTTRYGEKRTESARGLRISTNSEHLLDKILEEKTNEQ